MSLSKFESLPNEILIDIIEKYINGVDVLRAFSFQLNHRFNALITRCQRLRFDFIQCQRDDFRFCMGLLSAYIDKIEELAISEQDTPGQVYAFLSFFPSFASFKRLRTLYFHFNGEAIDEEIVEKALNSLLQTTIDNLSIKAINTEARSSLENIIVRLFGLKSLKRFSLLSNSTFMNWSDLANVSSNLEHLTISGINFQFQDLQYIFQCSPCLKYLDVQLINTYFYYSKTEKSSKKNLILMSTLRTLVLSFDRDSSITIDMLTQYFNCMPALNRLEIKAHSKLLDANGWKMLLETSLPLLTYFTLRTTASRVKKADLNNVLASFQSSYWISKKNFNIKITEHGRPHFNNFVRDQIKQHARYEFDWPVLECFTSPKYTVNNDLMIVNENISLSLDERNSTLSCHYYFDNVKCLIVDKMNSSLFKWLKTYVNCSKIRQLIITHSQKMTDELTALLSCLTNMSLLYMSLDLLLANIDAFMRKSSCVKHLDISLSEHGFNEEDIIIIAKCFPYVEHLKINTSSLYNVPLLKTYLVHLRSLTFEIENNRNYLFDNYDRKRWEYGLQRQTKFLFQVKNDTMTVWLDQAAFEESYWQTFAMKPSHSTALSNLTTTWNSSTTTEASDNQKKKKFKFSFLNFFK